MTPVTPTLSSIASYLIGMETESDSDSDESRTAPDFDMFQDTDSDEEIIPNSPDGTEYAASDALESSVPASFDENPPFIASDDFRDEDNGNQGSVDEQPTQYGGKYLQELTESDILALEFVSLEDASEFIHKYSKSCGFGLRKDDIDKDRKNNIIMRSWVCHKEGTREEKYLNANDRKREPRGQTRCGCKASFRVNLYRGAKFWKFRKFKNEHNHEMVVPVERQFLRSNRFVSDGSFATARLLRHVGVKTAQIMDFFAVQAGGYDKVGFTRKDLQNRFDYENRKEVDIGDTRAAFAFLLGQSARDEGFVYKYTVDNEDRLLNLFWCDSISKLDYLCFGDVIVFDATYRKNLYLKPLVVIVGINHHWRTTIFGFGLLSDETKETYTWLLQTFVTAMGDKRPRCVITDGDKSMRKAIREILPTAKHRLCSWHLYRNAVTNLKDKCKAQGFRNCMFEAESEAEFLVAWGNFLDTFSLHGNPWVVKAFQKRHLWAEYNFKGYFFARMSTNQRCESINSYLKNFLLRSLKLYEFVEQIDRSLMRVRHTENRDDYDSKNTFPIFSTHLREFEGQGSQILTRNVFNKFRSELLAERLLSIMDRRYEGVFTIYTITRYDTSSNKEWEVKFEKISEHMSCSCLCYESIGLPCSYLFCVMKVEKLRTIPDYLLLQRWRKTSKAGSNSFTGSTSLNQEGRMLTSYGALHSVTQKLHYFACSSQSAYNDAITELTKLADRIESMVLQPQSFQNSMPRRKSSNTQLVRDPQIVTTKGAPKKIAKKPRKRNTCQTCKQVGHNSQTCSQNPNVSNQPHKKRSSSQLVSSSDEEDVDPPLPSGSQAHHASSSQHGTSFTTDSTNPQFNGQNLGPMMSLLYNNLGV